MNDDNAQTQDNELNTSQSRVATNLLPANTDSNQHELNEMVQKSENEHQPRLPVDFYYDSEHVHAKPTTTNESIFPSNTLLM
jgi:hypothetical protein